MPNMTCDIVTPEARLFSEEAYMVVVPGIEGGMGILPGHEPLVTLLADGVVRIQSEKDGKIDCFAIQGGYVEVTGSKVIILADRACAATDIDTAEVNKKLSDTEAKLSGLSEEEAGKTTYAADISWCKAQIHAAEQKS